MFSIGTCNRGRCLFIRTNLERCTNLFDVMFKSQCCSRLEIRMEIWTIPNLIFRCPFSSLHHFPLKKNLFAEICTTPDDYYLCSFVRIVQSLKIWQWPLLVEPTCASCTVGSYASLSVDRPGSQRGKIIHIPESIVCTCYWIHSKKNPCQQMKKVLLL